jgi:hypothetical protein
MRWECLGDCPFGDPQAFQMKDLISADRPHKNKCDWNHANSLRCSEINIRTNERNYADRKKDQKKPRDPVTNFITDF